MNHKRIAVVGKMHSGKTTLANMLVDNDYERIAFADPVKRISAEMLTHLAQGTESVTRWQPNYHYYYDYDDMNVLKADPAIRKLLQLVGTELGRQWLGPEDLWIQMFKNDIKGISESEPIVNDDCRFVNEGAALREMGFTIIKLVRDETERIDSIRRALKSKMVHSSDHEIDVALVEILSHGSETEVDKIPFDVVVYNNDGTMGVLRQTVSRVLNDTLLDDYNVELARWQEEGGRDD